MLLIQAFLLSLEVLAVHSSQLIQSCVSALPTEARVQGQHHACCRVSFLLHGRSFLSAGKNTGRPGRHWRVWMYASQHEALAKKLLLCLVDKVPVLERFKNVQEFLVQWYQPGRHLLTMTWCFPLPSAPQHEIFLPTSYCLYCGRDCRLSYKDNIKQSNFSRTDQNLNTTNTVNRRHRVCVGKVLKMLFQNHPDSVFVLAKRQGSIHPFKPGTSLQKKRPNQKHFSFSTAIFKEETEDWLTVKNPLQVRTNSAQ